MTRTEHNLILACLLVFVCLLRVEAKVLQGFVQSSHKKGKTFRHLPKKSIEELGVIGVRLDSAHRINIVRDRSPAEEIGIRKGDRILRVNDGVDFEQIDGQPGVVVELLVERHETLLIFSVKRKSLSEMPWLPRSLYHWPKTRENSPEFPSCTIET